VPVGQTRVRITAEFTDSIATTNVFNFGSYEYGFAYNDIKYIGGMRNLNRALGFSLDDDSKLTTLQASWIGARNITWTLSFHHALINAAVPVGAEVYSNNIINFVSSAAVPISIGEVRASLPLLEHFTLDIEARYASDQPRPGHGSEGAGEVRLKYSL
jgi:hypothetical protein